MEERVSLDPAMVICDGSIWMRSLEKPVGWCTVAATRSTVFTGVTGILTSTDSTFIVRYMPEMSSSSWPFSS